MGINEYGVTGNGYILFEKAFSWSENSKLQELLARTFDNLADVRENRADVSMTGDWFYEEDQIADTLDACIPYGITEGEVIFIGDSDEHWRYIFRDGEWHKEDGNVSYMATPARRIADAFSAYVKADDRALPFVNRCLRETCALTDEELTEIFGEAFCLALKGGDAT